MVSKGTIATTFSCLLKLSGSRRLLESYSLTFALPFDYNTCYLWRCTLLSIAPSKEAPKRVQT